LRAGE